MEESILKSVKPQVGVELDVTAFDEDIITHINTVFTELNMLGVGPEAGFMIQDDQATWTQYMGNTDLNLNSVKSYMVLYVKFLFDPPKTSFAIDAMKDQIEKLGWTLNIKRENELWPLEQ